ncbi:putative isochorismatase family protein PncA [Caldalkalibacillus thermarum]|uniref:cysteine hydrolase family protein n=1 Tax=Caldalkalibacillus thermarum TaxID=296745 RepID=UPI001668C7E6|nr:isochorismatase family cysteine hydrolase [Caldalkalibacillus thermarum]GGK29567.1 putative isochorismatase family protein PncA [Caldalkalibacillus thermarum]
MEALIIIDYTYDFVADDGKLTCGEPGQAIEERITALTKQFVENGDYVVFAVDVHDEGDPYHPETKLFPPHNIRGTKGRDQYGALGAYYKKIKNDPQYQQQILWLDKTRYSAFAGTNLEIKLRERGINTVHLVGVCTDICVLHTAVNAYNKGFNIVVHEDAVQSFNQEGHRWAVEHFKSCLGAKVVSGWKI